MLATPAMVVRVSGMARSLAEVSGDASPGEYPYVASITIDIQSVELTRGQ